MKPKDLEQKTEGNDRRILEMATVLTNGANVKIFGTDNLERIPSGTRRRIQETLQGAEPMARKANRLLRSDQQTDAERIFEECLKSDANKTDDRFFGIFWSLGTLKLNQGNELEAVRCFKEALDRYPQKSRVNHFLQLIELMQKHTPECEQDIAAIAQRGLTIFHAEPALNGKELPQGDQQSLETLRRIFRDGEKEKAGRGRNMRIADVVMHGLPVNKQASDVARGNDYAY